MSYVYHKKMDDVWYSAAVQDDQLLATNFSLKDQDLGHLLGRLPSNVTFQVAEEPNQLLTEVLEALKRIFNGEDRDSYEFNIDMEYLSNYTRKVLNCTRLIPVGYVTTYGAIANVSGGIARSVGLVEASNPFPLLIPCHRVVRSDLSTGGYGYGTQVKLELLRREERGYEETGQLEVGNKELTLFPANQVKKR